MAKQVSSPVKAVVESNRIGFFGKIQSHGDFISEGLDRDLIGALDGWVQAGMHACTDVFTSRWSSVFSASPPLRFITERGIWGRNAYAGVLLPSRDRVGRKYPLVVLAQMADFNQHPRTLYQDDTWFMAAEAVAETSMTSDFDMHRFTTAVKRLRMPKPKGEDEDVMSSARSGQPISLWWYIDADTRRARGMRFEGKPTATDFVRLFREQISTDEAEATPGPKQTQETAAETKPAVEPRSAPAPKPLPHATAALSLVYSYATHPGTRLGVNADALFVSKRPALFAIADGVGDGSAAAEAARLTMNSLTDITSNDHPEFVAQDIKGKLGTVNSLLLSRQVASEAQRPMASVVVASLVENTLRVLWSGDARAYLMRNGTMHMLSRDHVIVGIKKQLSQCLGLTQQFRPDTLGEEWGQRDRLLLCSFPLIQALKERVVAEILQETRIDDCANGLIQEALIENVRENISAIVIGNRIEQQ